MNPTTYLVTKTFTEGILKGITITEKTTVKFTVGKKHISVVDKSAVEIYTLNMNKPISKKITAARLMRAIESGDYVGFCRACGGKVPDGVEPDARNYPCERCDKNEVFGAEELLMEIA